VVSLWFATGLGFNSGRRTSVGELLTPTCAVKRDVLWTLYVARPVAGTREINYPGNFLLLDGYPGTR